MNRPAAVEITYQCMRFLITHNPTNATLNKFTEVTPCLSMMAFLCSFVSRVSSLLSSDIFQELKKFHVNTLVRVCDATYDKAPVEKEGIQVVVWADTHAHFGWCFLWFFFLSFLTYTLKTHSLFICLLQGLALWWWCPPSHPDCGRVAQAAQQEISRGTRLLHRCALCGRAWPVSGYSLRNFDFGQSLFFF